MAKSKTTGKYFIVALNEEHGMCEVCTETVFNSKQDAQMYLENDTNTFDDIDPNTTIYITRAVCKASRPMKPIFEDLA